MTTKLFSVEEVFSQLDPAKVAQATESVLLKCTERVIREVAQVISQPSQPLPGRKSARETRADRSTHLMYGNR